MKITANINVPQGKVSASIAGSATATFVRSFTPETIETFKTPITVNFGGNPQFEAETETRLTDLEARSEDKHHTHRQDIASAIWNINHNLNKIPSVTVLDSAGDSWIVTPVYTDMNNLTITFQGAITGRAYLN